MSVGSGSSSPRSVLDQLELGLGARFLRALDAPADEVATMVLDCVDRDPRWGHQLDERGDYYALLLLATGSDVAAVEAFVADDEPAPGELDDGWALLSRFWSGWRSGAVARRRTRCIAV